MQAPNTEPFRVGFLNVDSYSHMPLWAPHINPRVGENDTPIHRDANYALLGY